MQNPIQILLAKPLFQFFVYKTQQLNQLNQSLRTVLTADLAEHCRVGNIEMSCLILHVDNAAWATRLRYEAPQILTTLKTHKDFATIETLRLQIQTKNNHNKAANHPPHKPLQSENIKNLLITTSQHIKNGKLKASLEKLASHMN